MSHHSPAVQDYLKAIYGLNEDGPATTQLLAERLGVTAASASNMLKRLDHLGLIRHESYRGASLTPAGRKIALEVIRHHRLLETYLAEALGVPWDRVHAEAEVLEHVLSEELEDRIAAVLGDPQVDPHGHPIPSKDGDVLSTTGVRLWDAIDGPKLVVARVSDQQAEALRYLAGAGIVPGSEVRITRRGPIEGPLFVSVGEDTQEVALSRELAESVWVG